VSLHIGDDLQILAQFVSSKRRVSIIDLADTRQRPNKSISDFIMMWISLSLQCPKKQSQQSVVQMCTNNLDPQIATYVGTAEPQNFDALVSKASNVERQLTHQKSIQSKREEIKRPNKKRALMATFVRASPMPTNDGNFNNGKGKQKEGARRLTLQERKEKRYPFDNDDVQGIFDELMAAKALSLPEPKRPAEVNMINDSKYCSYHRIISHPIKDCYVFKDIIEDMVRRGEIEIKGAPAKGPTASSNATSTVE